ncbi:MAG: hypothetical protein J6Z23_01945 [Lachnospiraceae bacterium]|nr:hypothetical protein [Lachnospiraceae bacterium]
MNKRFVSIATVIMVMIAGMCFSSCSIKGTAGTKDPSERDSITEASLLGKEMGAQEDKGSDDLGEEAGKWGYDYTLIPENVREEILSLFSGKTGLSVPGMWYDPDTGNGYSYYLGTFHGTVAFHAYGVLASMREMNIGKYTFFDMWFSPYVYSDHVLYDMEEAYDQGIITDEDLGIIYSRFAAVREARMEGKTN